jgi:hypothetical protein
MWSWLLDALDWALWDWFHGEPFLRSFVIAVIGTGIIGLILFLIWALFIRN